MKGSPSSASRPTPEAARPLVLAADDNIVTRRLISAMLGREGYRVLTFADGEDLLTHAPDTTPTLIMLDIMMPKMDGHSTLCALRANRALAAVPILMLSSNNQEEDVVRCLKAGAADYMIKPFSPQELAARVSKLIGRR
jgi:DNA-binding response OmpR family regulator